MKTYFNQNSWLLLLSATFAASSTWTTASAQETDVKKSENKVTIIRTEKGAKEDFFYSKSPPTLSKNHSSCRNYTYSWCSNLKNNNKGKPKLGVLLKGISKGTVILKVFPKTTAQAAGLQIGDKILSIDGKPSESIAGLQNIISSYKVGDKLTINYERDGKTHSSTSTFKETAQDHYLNRRTNFYHYKRNETKTEDFTENACEKLDEIYGKPFLGVFLNGSNYEEEASAMVSSIIDGTAAAATNLQADDRIIRINNKPIGSTKEAIAFIQSKNPGDKIRIHLIRDGQKMTIPATLGSYAESPQVSWKVRELEKYCEREAPEEPETIENKARVEPNETFSTLNKEATMQLFPNPTSDRVNIKFEGSKSPLTINIVGLDGKVMYTETIQSFNGNYNGQLDLSKYPAGGYLIHLNQDDKQISKQVVVE